MVKDLRRVRVTSEKDLRELLSSIREDHIPRLIEDDHGEAMAVIISPGDYARTEDQAKLRPRSERIRSLIGSWKDLDADAMIGDIYRWREEAPQSPDQSTYFDDPESRTTQD